MTYEKIYKSLLLEYEEVFKRMEEKKVYEFVEKIKKYSRIFLIGVGREGLETRAFAMRLMHMGKEVYWIWDDTTPSIKSGDLLVATLGDGEIGHIHYVCEKAKSLGSEVCVITGSPNGKTAKTIADFVLFIPAAVYRGTQEVVESIQPMGSLFEQCLLMVLDIVIMMAVGEMDDIAREKMVCRHRNIE